MTHPEPDTIVAVASAPGHGRRGIVRLSGPGPLAWLAPHLEVESGSAEDLGRGVVPLRLRGIPGVAEGLPCLMLNLRGPASYTGEDGLEFYPPGAPLLLRAIADGLIAVGRAAGADVGPAGPGAFTARAWRHGRIDLVEAEAVAAVISAADASELRAARELTGGPFVRRVDRLTEMLASILARVEAGIDFADEEDVVVVSASEVAERLAVIADDLSGPETVVRREASGDIPRVVLSGPANAGKSTLFNALLGEDAAIAAPTEGTTRDILERAWHVNAEDPAGGRVVRLSDSAGIDPRDADRGGARAEAHRRSHEARAMADLVLLCVPVDRPVPVMDTADVSTKRVTGSIASGRATIVVRTMLDHLGDDVGHRGAVDHASGDAWVSARTGEGLRELRDIVVCALDAASTEGTGAGLGLLARHRAAMGAAVERVEEAASWVRQDVERDPHGAIVHPEVVATLMRAALDELGSISGAYTSDDVLGLVFDSFCIGK